MRFKILFSVGGFSFDAERFFNMVGVQDSYVTRVGHRSLGTPREREFFKHVWTSRIVRVDEAPELAALQLMREIYDPIKCALEAYAQDVIAQDTVAWLEFVSYFDEGEEPRGFLFSVELLQMLARLGASLNMDAVNAP